MGPQNSRADRRKEHRVEQDFEEIAHGLEMPAQRGPPEMAAREVDESPGTDHIVDQVVRHHEG